MYEQICHRNINFLEVFQNYWLSGPTFLVCRWHCLLSSLIWSQIWLINLGCMIFQYTNPYSDQISEAASKIPYTGDTESLYWADSSTDTKRHRWKIEEKNPAYGRQRISRLMRIVAPITKKSFMSKSFQIWDHFFPLLFPKDSKNLKSLDIGLREVGAKRLVNGLRNKNTKKNPAQ